jgi:hypothetical protein
MSHARDLSWLKGLHERYLRLVTFQELRKGVVALSRIYVESRGSLPKGRVFDGTAKRAAFACYYAPLHLLFVREVGRELFPSPPSPGRIVDLGCGLAVAGAALASLSLGSPLVVGYEKNPWAANEARLSLDALGIRGRVYRRRLESAPAPRPSDLVVAAFSVNELALPARDELLVRLLEAGRRNAAVLVIEPIARRPLPWWAEWSGKFREQGGRDDAWRFRVELPEPLAALDRASGLDHRELTGRSLYLGAPGKST